MEIFNSFFADAFFIGGGLAVSLAYTIIAWAFGGILAVIFTILRHYKVFFLNNVVNQLISVIRGTPLLVQVVFFYYVFPAFGILIPGPLSALFALILNSSAYTAEILRGGLAAINIGQFQVSRSLGIPSFFMWKDIIIPQLLQICVPSLSSEFTTLFKDTSILYVIGGDDIMQRANSIGSATYSFVQPLFIAACYYYVVSSLITAIFSHFEKKLSVHVKTH